MQASIIHIRTQLASANIEPTTFAHSTAQIVEQTRQVRPEQVAAQASTQILHSSLVVCTDAARNPRTTRMTKTFMFAAAGLERQIQSPLRVACRKLFRSDLTNYCICYLTDSIIVFCISYQHAIKIVRGRTKWPLYGFCKI